MYPDNCNSCIQLHPKLQKCGSQVFLRFVVVRAQFPSPSFPCGSSPDSRKQVPLKPHLAAFGAGVHVNFACILRAMSSHSFFHGFHVTSHVGPKAPERASCAYPNNKTRVSRDARAPHYLLLWRALGGAGAGNIGVTGRGVRTGLCP